MRWLCMTKTDESRALPVDLGERPNVLAIAQAKYHEVMARLCLTVNQK
jgi:hypothetical protein